MTAAPASPPEPGAAGPRWQLDLLGGVRLHDGATVHTRLATRAMTALLARLALWPQRDHPREELTELLWPGVDASTGLRRLRQALSLLRAVLEPPSQHPVPVLQADRYSVRVVPGTIRCDVHVFEAQARAGQHAAALAAYRGELMPGFFDEWIHDERTRLAALHDRLAGGPMAGRPPLPTAAPQPGSPVDPDIPAPPPDLHASLPSYLTRYVPNEQQLQVLREQVLTFRMVTLLGPGGSGKTRLAVETAQRMAGSGAFTLLRFVPLAAAQTQEQLFGALFTALQIGTSANATEALVARLQGHRALLVLDNLEQLVGEVQGVLDSLAAALPQLHLLVTSRRPLELDGERLVAAEPLPLPAADASLQDAASCSAVVLFVDRARAVRVDFHLGARNHAAVVGLVRALEGMPLAIELAASRIRAYTPAEMLARLRAPAATTGDTPVLDLLARPAAVARMPTPQARHASMLRTIEWSWRQLEPELQSLAAAMAVFPGGCTAAMLAAVHELPDTGAGLEQLHAHSLIHERRRDPSPLSSSRPTTGAGAVPETVSDTPPDDAEPPRYQLYEPIREYATAQFDAGHGQRWRARQRAWALAWLQAQPTTPPLPVVRNELVNLAGALASAAADAAGADAARLLLALRPLHEGVTPPADALAQAARALDHCADAELRSLGCAMLATLLLTVGETPQAWQQAQTALALSAPATRARAWALQAVCHVHGLGVLGPPGDRLPWVEEALQIAEQLPTASDPDLLPSLLLVLALVRVKHDGDADLASTLATRARTLWETSGNRHAVNMARHRVAVYQFQSARYDKALREWDALIGEAGVLQDTRRRAVAFSARAAGLTSLRRWPQAVQALRESLQQAWADMRLLEVSYDLWNLPRALAHLGKPEEAMCLMAFSAEFWRTRFGELTAVDRRMIKRIDGMVLRLIGPRAAAAAAARGRQMALPDAVAMALSLTEALR